MGFGCSKKFLTIIILIALLANLSVPVFTSNNTYKIENYVDSTNRMKYTLVYYGMLDYLPLSYPYPDILIFAGTSENLDSSTLTFLRNMGVEIYAYIHDDNDQPVGMGSSFKRIVIDEGGTLDDWIAFIETLIDKYAGKTTGIFLDECDPAYFTSDLDPSNPLITQFDNGLGTIISYAHTKGLNVIVNGVRAYAGFGDYYLWEGWCSTWSGTTTNPIYTYVTDFFDSHLGDENPYSWVNDYQKLVYLINNDYISNTIAITHGPPYDYPREKACAESAAISGFTGWGYADANFYATLPGPYPVMFSDPGPHLSPPVISVSEKMFSRTYISGNLSVKVLSDKWVSESSTLLNLPNPDINYVAGNTGDADPGLDIVEYAISFDGYMYTIHISFQSSFTGNTIDLMIDSDNSSLTGYSNPSIDVYGADKLIEISSTGTASIYNYTGDGYSWSWIRDNSLPGLVSSNNVKVSIPADYVSGCFKIVSIDSSWNTADVEPDPGNGCITFPTGRYSYPLYSLKKVLSRQDPWGIGIIQTGTNKDTINVYAPTGYYSIIEYMQTRKPVSIIEYTTSGSTPIQNVASLDELYTSQEPGYYYERLTNGLYHIYIKAGPHQSPVTLEITYEAENLGDKIYTIHNNIVEYDGNSQVLTLILVLGVLSTIMIINMMGKPSSHS